jgi:FHS family glucose/mannose:H+ symporter-like MFS transporter
VIGVGAAGLSLLALAYGLLGPSLPLLADTYRVDFSEQGALMTLYALGYLLAVLAGGYAADRRGKERLLTVGFATMGVGLLAAGYSSTYAHGLAALGAIGAGGGFLEMTVTAIVSDRLPDKRGTALNLLQFVFGLSSVSPLLVTWALASTGSWRIPFYALGAIALLLGSSSLMVPRRRVDSRNRITISGAAAVYRRPRLWVIAATEGIYAFSEVSLLSWAATYLVSARGASPARANGALSLFWVLFALGRLGCSALSSRIRPDRIIVVLTAASTATLSAAILVSSSQTAWFLMAMTGLFYSGVFGTILAYAGDTYPHYSGTVFGLVLAVAAAGAVAGPWLIGTIAETTNLALALGAVALAMLITGAIYVLLGPSRQDRAAGLDEVLSSATGVFEEGSG